MIFKTEKFDRWIRKHRYFAMVLPIVIMLGVFFISTSLQSFQGAEDKDSERGYNNTLPNQQNALEVQRPNALYKQSLKDSLNDLKERGSVRNLIDAEKENDSLERILEELNSFSFNGTTSDAIINKEIVSTVETPTPEAVSKKTAAEKQLEYRQLLLTAREQRLSKSQDYSAPYSAPETTTSAQTISFDAAIYRDQFFLPGNRITLILREDVYHNGKLFPKNTFVYATANLMDSRVLLEVGNINKVPMALTGVDHEDGMIGLHNERAGQLLQEFNADLLHQGVDELSETAGRASGLPLTRNLTKSFSNFFKKKKYRQQDKILLINGDRVLLVPKT